MAQLAVVALLAGTEEVQLVSPLLLAYLVAATAVAVISSSTILDRTLVVDRTLAVDCTLAAASIVLGYTWLAEYCIPSVTQ